MVQDALLCGACTQQLAARSRQSPCSTAVLDAVLPTTAGVLCIESQAELTLVLARASGPIPQAATRRLRAVLVAAVSSRARRTGGTLRFYCPYPLRFYCPYPVRARA